jgi:hypothetical protein
MNREITIRLGWVYGFCYASIASRWGSRIRRAIVHEQTSKLLKLELTKLDIEVSQEQLGRFSRGPMWGRIRDHLIAIDLIKLTSDGLIIAETKNRRKSENLFTNELLEFSDDFKAYELDQTRKSAQNSDTKRHSDLFDEMFGDIDLDETFETDREWDTESGFNLAVPWHCSDCAESAQECGHNNPDDVNLISSGIVKWVSFKD